MLVKTRGILLHTLPYGESSVIVEIYTEEIGMRKYILNGARGKNSKIKPSCLQVMALLDLVVYEKNIGHLQRVKEINNAWVYRGIPFDLYKGSIGLFMADMIRKAIRQTNPEPGLFNFLYRSFTALDNLEERNPLYHLIFLLQLSGYLGFQPIPPPESGENYLFNLREGCFEADIPDHGDFADRETSGLLGKLMKVSGPVLKKRERALILELLIRYYRLHIEGFPEIQSHHILQQVL
jgi:DNA repair protein RecO (recombination protein O)